MIIPTYSYKGTQRTIRELKIAITDARIVIFRSERYTHAVRDSCRTLGRRA